jgi:hypothetical protein
LPEISLDVIENLRIFLELLHFETPAKNIFGCSGGL